MEHAHRQTEVPLPPAAAPAAPVSIKALAVPHEHGGWGLLGEPIVLGLALAPTWAGLGLAIAAVGAFLGRHPLRLALSDRQRGGRYPRTAAAERVAAVYLVIAAAGLAAAVSLAPTLAFAPLLAAAPLGLLQLTYDARLRGRELLPELAGGVALGAVAAAMAMAGGWRLAPALALWLVLAARVVVSVLYVRARLRAARGLAPDRRPALGSHVVALIGVGTLAARGHAPWLALPAFAVLLARAVLGLRRVAPPVPPRRVGFEELGYGVLTLLLLGLGYRLGL